MFAPHCPTHGHRLLLGYESVVGVENTPSGPVVLLACHCGTLLTYGRTATSAPSAQSAAPAGDTRPAAAAQANSDATSRCVG